MLAARWWEVDSAAADDLQRMEVFMMQPLRTHSAVWSAVLLSLAATGCCSTFERDWQAALSCPQPADRLAGLWEGTWESESRRQCGALRAIVTPCGPNRYSARYDARFCWFVPYGHDMLQTATDDGLVTHFRGEEDGGLIGGVYRAAGWSDGANYIACCEAQHDKGTFRMRRVGCVAGVTLERPPFESEVAPPPPAPARAYEEATILQDDSVPPRPPQ